MKPFRLNHVACYAKGWYKRSDNIFNDLKKCLSCDGYSGEIMSDRDVYTVVLIAFEDLTHKYYHNLSEIMSGIHPDSCWERGYYHKDNAQWFNEKKVENEYDMQEAVLRYCLSCFQETDKEDMSLTGPDYVNCLPPSGNHCLESYIKMFKK